MYKRFALQGLLSLLINLIFSVFSGFVSIILFGLLLKPVTDELSRAHGKQYAQNLLEFVGFVLFVLITTFIAYVRGKRRTKREKIETGFYWKFSSAAMAVFIIPALLLFNGINPALNRELLVVYFPFLFLKNTLRFTQHSLILTAVLANALQGGAFALGRSILGKTRQKDIK